MSAIQAVVKILVAKNVNRRIITILSDKQADIKALDSSVINSKAVYYCRRCFNKTANRYGVCITGVPEHRDIPGNCRADKSARRGTIFELSD